LSKKAWEEKLGAFQPATIAKAKSRGSDGYKIRPMASNVDTTALWQKYQLERVQSGGTSWRMEKAKERRDRSIKSAKIGARAKRALIKLMEPGLGKRMLRHQVSQGLLKEIKQINQAYMNERASYIKDTGNRLIWHDWLKAQAAAGNTEAIAVLRGRYERQNMKGNVIANSAPGNDNLEIIKTERKIDTVTKRGTVHLKVPGGIIRDDGKSFRMSDSLSDNALRVMLRLAVERFGTQLDVRGTEKFKSAIVNIVHCEKINVTFSDPAMMKQKQALLEQRIAAEKRQKTIAAAEKYVANQNDKHSKGMAHILPHRLFKPEEAGQYIFGGWRSQEEGRMALLKSAPTAKEILVLPLDPDSFQRIRFLDDGSKIAVSPSGDLQIIENARSQSQTLVRQIGHHTSR
jgi:hypothetical protein